MNRQHPQPQHPKAHVQTGFAGQQARTQSADKELELLFWRPQPLDPRWIALLEVTPVEVAQKVSSNQ
jgi:hypothetical protein